MMLQITEMPIKNRNSPSFIQNVSMKQLFKFGMFLVCIVGFVYQASITWKQYFEYNTTTMVELEEESILEYPGVTICLGEIVSEKNLDQWYPDYVCLKKKYPKGQPEDANLTCNNPSGKTNARDLYYYYSNEAIKDKPIMELFGSDWIPLCEMEMLPLAVNSTEDGKRLPCGR